MSIYNKILKIQRSGKSAVLATVVKSIGSAPRKEGAKMLVHADGSIDGTIGGGAVEKAVIEEALKIMGSSQTRLLDYDLGKDLAMSCGGKMSIFLESLAPQPQLFIFGAGHIGRALTKIARMLNFQVTVIDNRPEFANSERLPEASTIIADDYGNALNKIEFPPDSYIVLVTHRHAHDQMILEHCVNLPFKYLGMIGSRNKVKKAFDLLREKGVPEETISRIHSPIGLDIGADTPEEIAVAIAGELIGVRSGKLAVGDELVMAK